MIDSDLEKSQGQIRYSIVPIQKWFLFTAAIFAFVGQPSIGFSLPSNPQRPNTATTCVAAQDRLLEALTGSSLISENETDQTIIDARERAEQLCSLAEVQDVFTLFHIQTAPN